jgi:alpha-tubulin suppressor-like RCC1 family protein
MEYWNGSAWVSYLAGTYAQIPGDGDNVNAEAANLLVRVALVNDILLEAAAGETFTLTARSMGATVATGTASIGTATIKDDGTGTVFSTSVNVATANTPVTAIVDTTTPPNDDRVLISNVRVNENGGFAAFNVTSPNTQIVFLSIVFTGAGGAGNAVIADIGTALEYWDAATAAWVGITAGAGVQMTAGQTLSVRIAIVNDGTAEGPETFVLQARDTTGATGGILLGTGTATIVENASGSSFATIAPITVNENSPYALFTIQNANGRPVKLSLAATNYQASAANDNAAIGTDIANSLQYWNGGIWVNYVNDSTITAPNIANLLVRVSINEQDAYEGPETFTLRVADSSNNVIGYGVATIMDNGTGTMYTGDATVTDASAAFAAATTDAERAAALEIWRQINEVKSNAIVAGTYGAFYKAANGNYYVTGYKANADGVTNLTTSKELTSTNGYSYTGAIIDVAAVSSSATTHQYLLLTTDGLYAWGSSSLAITTTSVGFQKISTPSHFIAADVKSMAASNNGVMFVMKDGTVRNSSFAQVKVTGGSVLTGITDVQYSNGQAFAVSSEGANSVINKFYTWGTSTYLGDNSVAANRTDATVMANPLPTGVQAVQIGISTNTYFVLGSDGKVYVLGSNSGGVAGQGTATALTSWTTMLNKNGIGALSDVQYISALDAGILGNTASRSAFGLILRDGSILGVGSNSNDRLGTGSNALLPIAPTGAIANSQVYTIELGGAFSAALLYGTTDVVYTTGAQNGAAGNGTTTGTSTFTQSSLSVNLADAPATSLTITNPTSADLRDDTGITVNSIVVNETANTFAVFVVEIDRSQTIQMALAAGTAAATTDYTNSISYWNGSAWTTPAASINLSVTAGQRLHVRVPILVTTGAEANETFTLNISDVEGSPMKSATATIVENGSGTAYATSAPPATVNSIDVNEASPYAVFRVTGVASQKVTLSLAGGTASLSEYGSALEIYNGTSWVAYTANSFAVIPSPGSTLLVRTTITNDNLLDNDETFRLIVANEAGVTAVGIATIKDDGTGDLFSIQNNTGSSELVTENGLPDALDNDQNRPLSINSVEVNEGSSYAVFTVSGAANQVLSSLALIAGTSNTATGSGADFGTSTGTGLEYWNGTAWVIYSTGDISIDAAGVLLVRTPIVNDSAIDNNETFRLSIESANGQIATGTATIKDDGTGTIFAATASIDGVTAASSSTPVTAQTVASPTTSLVPAANAADLPNEDRLFSVTSVTVNEGSPFAIFKITGETGQYTRLSLASVTATIGTDTGAALQYYDGTAWQNYSTGSFVKISSAGLLVRVAINNDNGASVGEPGETFKLIAQNTNGTPNSVGGIGTIMDDGTGSLFGGSNTTGVADAPGVNGAPATLDRDYGITSVIVNEGSPFVVFSVVGGKSGSSGSNFDGLNSITITAGTATAADYGTAVQYWNGSSWTAFVSNMSISNKTLMRFAITNDILN